MMLLLIVIHDVDVDCYTSCPSPKTTLFHLSGNPAYKLSRFVQTDTCRAQCAARQMLFACDIS